MTHSTIRWIRQSGLALALAAGTAATASAASAAPATSAVTASLQHDTTKDVEVTEADVAASNKKIGQAFQSLVAMWSKDFEKMGRFFEEPSILSYRGYVRTPCGGMEPGNAAYCSTNNTVYFDEVFVALQGKEAAIQLGTDGDMAGIGIIAHETGHAAATQLGIGSRVSIENEAIADCMAGTFARRAQEDGSLEPGDLEEAYFGLAAAGDPAVELTGDRRIDSRRLASAQRMGHGTSDQRLSNFRTGLDRGLQGCVAKAKLGTRN